MLLPFKMAAKRNTAPIQPCRGNRERGNRERCVYLMQAFPTPLPLAKGAEGRVKYIGNSMASDFVNFSRIDRRSRFRTEREIFRAGPRCPAHSSKPESPYSWGGGGGCTRPLHRAQRCRKIQRMVITIYSKVILHDFPFEALDEFRALGIDATAQHQKVQ